MADYRFVTTWKIRAPQYRVWQSILDTDRWPEWWKGVLSVTQTRAGNADGIGAVRHFVWKSKLPYTLGFDMEVRRIDAPHLLEGAASGELTGTGVWELNEKDGVTIARYTWSVRTTRRWMNLLAPIARPIFAWNHDYIMASGAAGLSKLLGAELVGQEA